MASALNILLVGCGKMGTALAKGWLDSQDINASLYIIEPNGLPDGLKDDQDRLAIFENAEIFQEECEATARHIDILVLAVKPQIMAKVCPALKAVISKDSLILSIAAGQTIDTLASFFHDDQPIIRSMPNTPAAVGAGITVAAANRFVTDAQKKNAEELLHVSGAFEWADNEALLDAVTAVSGSGPAYVFLMIEAMTEAGIAMGLPEKLAEKLARETVIGAGQLAKMDAQTSAATLRENVTSPGGTTAAALSVLMENDALKKLMGKAVDAATKRSRELSA